jgi:hypothetical protein
MAEYLSRVWDVSAGTNKGVILRLLYGYVTLRTIGNYLRECQQSADRGKSKAARKLIACLFIIYQV